MSIFPKEQLTPHKIENNNKQWKETIRDYWYSLQDIANLPETKRVELEHIVKSILTENKCDDAVVEQVVSEIRNRSKVGLNKYGETLEESNKPPEYWLQHAKEEALDLANYLQKAINVINKNKKERET